MTRSFLRHLIAAIAAIVVMHTALLPVAAQADDSKESLVKAAFIYNFLKFVEWPDGKAVGKQSSIDICVIGDSGISQAGVVFKQASTAQLKLSMVEETNWHNAANHCHILFISSSEENDVNNIINGLKGKPVLTVSDMDDFAEHGGMIGFVMQDNKVKLAVNKKPLATAGLRVDAQLLEIALKVIDK